MGARQILRPLLGCAATLLLGGLLAATFVRLSPGFGLDEETLDPRLDSASLQALRAAHAGERNVAAFYARHMAALLRGDLGFSRSFERPISALLAERAPVTFKLMALGVLGGWALGLALALPTALRRFPVYNACATALTSLLLCIPAAALALLLFFHGGPVRAVIALVLFPKVFHYVRDLLAQVSTLPHVLAARAKGLRPARILL